jgi:hypothetical protein
VKIPRTDKYISVGSGIQPRDPEVRGFIAGVEKVFGELISEFRNSFAMRRFTSRFRGLLYMLAVLDAYPGILDCSKKDVLPLIMKEARFGGRVAQAEHIVL